MWWSYRRIEWWRIALARRVTPLGWIMIAMLLASGIFGTDIIKNGLAILFCFLSILMAVEICSLLFRKSKIEVSGTNLPVLFAGDETMVPFQVTSLHKVNRCSIALFPYKAVAGFQKFYEAREPKEEKRNAFDRMLKYYRWRWLHDDRAFYSLQSEVLNLREGERRQVSLRTKFYERGVWPLIDVRTKRIGIFGLFQRSLKTKGERNSVYVAPTLFPVSRIDSHGVGRSQEVTLETRPKPGESQEFMSLRDYQPGDSWRKVNWKALARTEKMMVQENEDFAVPRYTVIWETKMMSKIEFETAASVLASIVTSMSESGEAGQAVIRHGGGVRAFDWESSKEELFRELASIQYNDIWEESDEVADGEIWMISKEKDGDVTWVQIDETRVNGIPLEEGVRI